MSTASCYLLEFSVGPGGARQGDVHAATDVERLRAAFERRYDDDHLAYMTLWYGAMLHLWIVQDGVVTAGIDLHDFLRTGEPSYDRAVVALLYTDREDETWQAFDGVLEPGNFDTLTALRAAAHVHDLANREAEELPDVLERIIDNELGDVPGPPATLTLDWAAITAAAPPLREPLLRPGGTTTIEPGPDVEISSESYLDLAGALHLGLNDLEAGHHEPDEG